MIDTECRELESEQDRPVKIDPSSGGCGLPSATDFEKRDYRGAEALENTCVQDHARRLINHPNQGAIKEDTPITTTPYDIPAATSTSTHGLVHTPRIGAMTGAPSHNIADAPDGAESDESDDGLTLSNEPHHVFPGLRKWTPRLAAFPLPLVAEIWLEVCKQIEAPTALAQLAMVCQGLHDIAGEVLYRHVRITSQARLDAFRATLDVHPHKAPWTRSFVLLPRSGEILVEPLVAILENLRRGRLEHFELRFPCTSLDSWSATTGFDLAVAYSGGFTLPASVRSVDAHANFLRGVRAPLPALTCLSLSLRRQKELAQACREIARFGKTLLRLRIRQRLPWRMSGENPMGICAQLDTPQLEYLEVQEEATLEQSDFPSPQSDGVPDRKDKYQGVPKLRSLVWAPSWGDARKKICSQGGGSALGSLTADWTF
ncbi:hypothetical protein C8Q76DRAFT_229738 [Earliella scabrosa]|nr:hypothetical protein C8Q76DRAFT_229738 [Earliella scabrosa]